MFHYCFDYKNNLSGNVAHDANARWLSAINLFIAARNTIPYAQQMNQAISIEANDSVRKAFKIKDYNRNKTEIAAICARTNHENIPYLPLPLFEQCDNTANTSIRTRKL